VRLEDRWLIRRFNAGDTRALRRIYEEYQPSLLGVARALLNDASAAEDVLHDVVVGFASQAGRFVLKGSLKGYLAICVANRARNVNRQGARPDRSELPERGRRQGSVSESVLDEERRGIVVSAMEQLPEEQRQVIALHVLGGLRFREIAQQSDESINTVQSRYRYGLKKLRSLLDGQVDL